MHELTIDLTTRPGELIARLDGDVDVFTCGRLEELRALIGVAALVLDLRGVGFVDSAGTDALRALAAEVEAAGGRLLLAGASPQVVHLLGRCGGRFETRADAPRPGRFARDDDRPVRAL